MPTHLTSEQREAAIAYLVEQGTEEILHNAYNRSVGDDWSATHYFSLGIWVRNKLRERFAWDDLTLDQAWAGLIEEA